MRIFNYYRVGLLVVSPATLAISFLTARIYFSGSLFLGFLIWNLFLSYVPLILSSITSYFKLKGVTLFSVFVIWLLFLPNAPYIITDYKHLFNHRLLYLDIIIIGCFAYSGLISGLYSIYQMQKYFENYFIKPVVWYVLPLISMACGMGIYLVAP